jgi:ABC-type antimicrobial peptide transport system permease subunit
VIDYGTAKDFGFPNKVDGTPLTKEDSQKIIVNKDSLSNFYYFTGRTAKNKAIDLEKDKVTAMFQEYQLPEGKKAFNFPLNDKYIFIDAEEGTEYYWNSYIDIDYFKELYTKYANTLKAEDRKKAIKSLSVYEQIVVNVDNIRDVSDVIKQINELGVNSYSNMEQLNTMQDTADMLKMVFGAIGLVALIVSAINIANTMIMSIYERTKEIGVMKVLGCLVFDIKKLFLFEAGLIGFIGGVIGIGFSFVASWAVNKYGGPLLSNIIPGNGWYVDSTGAKFSQISITLTLQAVLVSIGVGVISGFFPARRATKISAIEAMKTEN